MSGLRLIAAAGFAVPLLALVAGTAAAADTPAKVLKPAPAAAYAPAFAAHPELRTAEGEAAARCKVSAAGAISGCTLAREFPANTAWGPALLAAAPQFQVTPATHDGRPVDSEIVLQAGRLRYDQPVAWLRKPTANDLLAVWPRDALRKGIDGEANIDCLVNTEGALFDCLVARETPAGLQYGQAALALTPQFLMKPARLAGQPVVSQVTIPVNFKTLGPRNVPEGVRTATPAMAWEQAPTYADVAAAYPPKAREKKLGGHATLYCMFARDGRLTDCDTLTEEPRGEGFAAAARKLAGKFRAYPPTDGKGFAHAAVQIPVTFDPAMLEMAGQVIGKPQWAALPGAEDVQAAFKGTPRNIGTVRVVLACVAQQGGWMGGCTVASETPPGKGLGPAALSLATKVRMTTWTSEGLPVVGGRINLPIRYESGAPEAAATPAAAAAGKPSKSP